MKTFLFIFLFFAHSACAAQTLTFDLAKDGDRISRASNQMPVKKYGFNDNVGASLEDIWSGGATYTGWLTVAKYVRVAAGGNVNDTAAGTGCREVTAQGLDSSWVALTFTVATNGALASDSSSIKAFRINRAYCSDVGTYGGTPAGDVTIETTDGTVLAIVEASSGQTEMSMYTVEAGHALVVESLETSVNSANAANIEWFFRPGANVTAAPFSGARLFHRTPDLTGAWQTELDGTVVFDQYTDVWVRALRTAGSSASVSTTMIGRLVRK